LSEILKPPPHDIGALCKDDQHSLCNARLVFVRGEANRIVISVAHRLPVLRLEQETEGRENERHEPVQRQVLVLFLERARA